MGVRLLKKLGLKDEGFECISGKFYLLFSFEQLWYRVEGLTIIWNHFNYFWTEK